MNYLCPGVTKRRKNSKKTKNVKFEKPLRLNLCVALESKSWKRSKMKTQKRLSTIRQRSSERTDFQRIACPDIDGVTVSQRKRTEGQVDARVECACNRHVQSSRQETPLPTQVPQAYRVAEQFRFGGRKEARKFAKQANKGRRSSGNPYPRRGPRTRRADWRRHRGT